MRERINKIVKDFLVYAAGIGIILSAVWNVGTFVNKWFQQTKMSTVCVGVLQAEDLKINKRVDDTESRIDRAESRIDVMEECYKNVDKSLTILVKKAINK